MTLRGEPVEHAAVLPDGRELLVRIGVPDDPYIPKRELSTVALELFERGRGLAAVTTVLDPEQTSEARQLLREVVAGLESGSLPPTAAALEPLADELRRL
jgi:hypothetical protein